MHWDCYVAVPENMGHRTSSLKKLGSRILKSFSRKLESSYENDCA